MADDSMFFEIAAGLLPALMLAGLLSDKLKPSEDRTEAPPWPFWLILISGGYFVFAEVVAIRAAISGEPSGFDRVVVSIALIAAAISTVALLLLPWIENVETAQRRVPIGGVVVVLLVLGGSSVFLLYQAIGDASTREDAAELREIIEEQRRTADALFAEHRRINASEARLERELSRLNIRRANLLSGPRERDTRAKVFLIDQDIRLVRGELDLLDIREQGISLQLEVLAADPEELRELAP